MDREKIARELVAVARELTGGKTLNVLQTKFDQLLFSIEDAQKEAVKEGDRKRQKELKSIFGKARVLRERVVDLNNDLI